MLGHFSFERQSAITTGIRRSLELAVEISHDRSGVSHGGSEITEDFDVVSGLAAFDR